MSLSYSLNRLYYKSSFYVIFHIFQILMSVVLVCYLINDVTHNSRKGFVIAMESLILLFMVIDVSIYNIVNGCHITLIGVVEWIVIFGFIVCLGIITMHDGQRINEEIEVYLIVVRFFLQIARLFLSITKLKETTQKRKTAANIEITINNSQAPNEQNSSRNIEMVDI